MQSILRRNETIAADNFHTAHKRTAGVSPAASREEDLKLIFIARLCAGPNAAAARKSPLTGR
jgi:hypothetical protein